MVWFETDSYFLSRQLRKQPAWYATFLENFARYQSLPRRSRAMALVEKLRLADLARQVSLQRAAPPDRHIEPLSWDRALRRWLSFVHLPKTDIIPAVPIDSKDPGGLSVHQATKYRVPRRGRVRGRHELANHRITMMFCSSACFRQNQDLRMRDFEFRWALTLGAGVTTIFVTVFRFRVKTNKTL